MATDGQQFLVPSTTATPQPFVRLLLVLVVCTRTAMTQAMKVLVTGAAGRTGRLVLSQLAERPGFEPYGLVRREQPESKGAARYIVADICDAAAVRQACHGMDAIIICTSATPAPTGATDPESGRPLFAYPNGSPEQVDWLGQKNQIDAAKAEGVSHVVICSSMGGTNPANPLNALGRAPDGSGGNILLWKRKAEKYLMDSLGLTYTIVHPGGLIDEPGGEREIVVGVDDEQLETENRSIPRADVAALLVAALENASYRNRSFDARTKPIGEGTVTTDLGKLLEDMTANCDYSKGTIPN